MTKPSAPVYTPRALLSLPLVDAPAVRAYRLTDQYRRFLHDLTAAVNALRSFDVTDINAAIALLQAADVTINALITALTSRVQDLEDAGFALLAGGNSFTGAQTVAFVTLTDAATINTDASLSNSFAVTLGGNRTLANPTNMRDGGIYNWRIKQSTGSNTLAYGSKFKWPSAAVPVLSTSAGAVDMIVGQYHAADDRIEAVFTKGFA